ncbi:MAG: MBOAT family protein [Bacteroidales bacterium]
MIFSSGVFLFIFLPIILVGNFLLKKEFKNIFLLIGSLIFFAWGGVSYSAILILSLLINYFSGLAINYFKGTKKKTSLIIAIILNIGVLGTFKYADFIVENINHLSNLFKFTEIKAPGIILPIGISFYTFQAMSYIIDVYREEVGVQKNFFKLALYISFFPQLIAGPIVRYKDIEKQINERKDNIINLTLGIQRFVLGLVKKVIIADQFALVADTVFNISDSNLGFITAWIGIAAYTIQIYFDFSGYSDMAIGLGKMFGFQFPENFNFPYIAKSIREFWQRWHITLSSWFRNYLYFSLGGNKKSQSRTIINLLIVFFATSIWHGANWNFVIWGMTHGFFMMLERLGLAKILNKLWTPIQHIYTLFIVMTAWIFFRSPDFSHGYQFLLSLFNFQNSEISYEVKSLVFTNLFLTTSIIALISCTPFWLILKRNINNLTLHLNHKIRNLLGLSYQIGESLTICSGLYISSIIIISDSYSPFIYFQF